MRFFLHLGDEDLEEPVDIDFDARRVNRGGAVDHQLKSGRLELRLQASTPARAAQPDLDADRERR